VMAPCHVQKHPLIRSLCGRIADGSVRLHPRASRSRVQISARNGFAQTIARVKNGWIRASLRSGDDRRAEVNPQQRPGGGRQLKIAQDWRRTGN
jgi:hypothetical protein